MSLDLTRVTVLRPDGTALFPQIDLSIPPGTIATLTGASGVGLTVMKTVAVVVRPSVSAMVYVSSSVPLKSGFGV